MKLISILLMLAFIQPFNVQEFYSCSLNKPLSSNTVLFGEGFKGEFEWMIYYDDKVVYRGYLNTNGSLDLVEKSVQFMRGISSVKKITIYKVVNEKRYLEMIYMINENYPLLLIEKNSEDSWGMLYYCDDVDFE